MQAHPQSKLYIDGQLRDAEGGRTFDNISPWTRNPCGKVAAASAADVDAAISAARRAFDETDWSRNRDKRLEYVSQLYDCFQKKIDRLVQMVRDEAGATLMFASMAQIGMAFGGWRDLIEAFGQVRWVDDRGVRGAEGAESHRLVVREPAGVVGAITPFNVPFYCNIEKIVSALLAGCTVILKPSPDTPLLGAIWGEVASEVGLPPGVLNVITGPEPELGEQLVTDRRVDLITFTGSSAVGEVIMRKGSATLKRILLELGGKSARIILDDAPDFEAQVAASILVAHSGQGCAAQSRLLVPRSRYAEATEILKRAYAGFEGRWGQYDDPNAAMGPVVSKKQLDRIKGYVDLGVKEGATLLVGGRVRDDLPGYFIEPACFIDVDSDMRIAQEEIFGPVLVVISYEDDDDAARIANNSEYGLSGSIVTGDLDRGLALAARIRTGTIAINGARCIDGDLPFSGYKRSGLGRAWGPEGIESYMETKVIAFRSAPGSK